MASYILMSDGPQFSPHLKIESDQNFYKLLNSLLDSTVEMGGCMQRIDDSQLSYNVKFYLYYFQFEYRIQFIDKF